MITNGVCRFFCTSFSVAMLAALICLNLGIHNWMVSILFWMSIFSSTVSLLVGITKEKW